MSSDIVQDFEDSLKDLVANNKYEINNLTLISRESTEYAQEISRVLEQHIARTQPQRKLPALYVLDSIVKNVGTPYTIYLGRNLFKTFMEAYSLVDGSTRKAMEALLQTWKQPVYVFDPELVKPIENALMKLKMVTTQRQPQPMYQAMPTPPQYHNQFLPPATQSPHMQYPQIPQPQYRYQPPQPQYMPPQLYNGQQMAPATQWQPPMQYVQQFQPVSTPQPAPAQLAPVNQNYNDLSALLRGLQQPQATPVPPPVQPPAVGSDLLAALAKITAQAKQSTPVPQLPTMRNAFAAINLNALRPELIEQLYPAQSVQCPQCGRRFDNTTTGLKRKDLHLDWHFRINQRMADATQRLRHRDWFSNETEWMKMVEFDESTATSNGHDAADTAVITKSKSDAQPWIKAPPGVTQVTCRICFEEIRSSYLEEMQEWVLANAAMNNGKIVHASCLAEMQQGSSGGVAAATVGVQDLAQSLLSSVPTKPIALATSLTKRKADDEDISRAGKIPRESH